MLVSSKEMGVWELEKWVERAGKRTRVMSAVRRVKKIRFFLFAMA